MAVERMESSPSRVSMVDPRSIVSNSIILAALPPGAFVGSRFNLEHCDPALLVDVRGKDGRVIPMHLDGQRRTALAVRDKAPLIPVKNVTKEYLVDYPGQTALEPSQYLEIMHRLHNSTADNKRMVSHVLTQWQLNVGHTESSPSAFSALLFLGLSTLEDRTPTEIGLILQDSGHPLYPGNLIVDQGKSEEEKIRTGIVDMATSIATVNIPYENMIVHALSVVDQMIKNPDPAIQEDGHKQIRGLLTRPEVQTKISTTTEPEFAAARLTDLLTGAFSAIDLEQPAAITKITSISDMLFNPKFSYETVVNIFQDSQAERGKLLELYDLAKQEINGEMLFKIHKVERQGAFPDVVKQLLTNVAGTKLLNRDDPADAKKIKGMLELTTHAAEILATVRPGSRGRIGHLATSTRTATSLGFLRRAVTALEKALTPRQPVGESASPVVEVVIPTDEVSVPVIDVTDPVVEPTVPEVVTHVTETIVFPTPEPEPEVLPEEKHPLETAIKYITGLRTPVGQDDRRWLRDLIEKAREKLGANVPEKGPLVLDEKGFPTNWKNVPFDPVNDGREVSWFKTKFKSEPTPDTHRRTTLIIHQAARKIFSDLHQSWGDVLASVQDGSENSGLNAIDHALSIRFGMLNSSVRWSKRSSEFIYLSANHLLLSVNARIRKLENSGQAGDGAVLSQLHAYKTTMETQLHNFRKDSRNTLQPKPDIYLEMLQYVLYSPLSDRENEAAAEYIKNQYSDTVIANGRVAAMKKKTGHQNIQDLFESVILATPHD